MRLDKSLDSHNPEAFDSHAPYSVLMSVYRKEDPSHLLEALDSMVSQTVPPEEIVLVFLVKSVFRVSSLIFFGFRHEECRPVVCFTGCPSCRT